jgi:uncharacterized protein (DUF983 family)
VSSFSLTASILSNVQITNQQSHTANAVTRWAAIRNARCPRCRRGAIYERVWLWRLPVMHAYCPECGLKYEREQGYFLGAMYISYGLALITIFVIALVLWLATAWSVERDIVIAALLFLPLVPILVTISRVLWIHFDRAVDPDW